MSTLFQAKFLKQDYSVHLITDTDSSGFKAWYFVKVGKHLLNRFVHDVHSKAQLDLSRYGEVLYSAYGETPPAHIQNMVRVRHGWKGLAA